MKIDSTGLFKQDPVHALCRYGFYLAALLLLYGTLFPFQFDVYSRSLALAFDSIRFVPYWDIERGRIHSLPDIVSNILLTVPLGFFGFLSFAGKHKAQSCARWLAWGFLLGLLAEVIQIGIPSRVADSTDAINNGLGSFLGAWAASIFGPIILNLFSGSLYDTKQTNFIIMLAVIGATMLIPLDFGMDVSQLKSSLKQLLQNPWELGTPLGDEWIQLVEFAMIGALAGSIGRRRLMVFAILLPIVLEPIQILVEFHSPSCRDMLMGLMGVGAGLLAAHYPALVRPIAGFILINIALIAQGLSPYQFVGWNEHSHFNWVPLVEYYYQTTGAALYDAMSGLLSYALLVALWPTRAAVLWAILLAGSLEAAQVIIPARFAGTTDILVALCGACAAYALSKAIRIPWANNS
jgi:glycopeptide antibiotics resistance protein